MDAKIIDALMMVRVSLLEMKPMMAAAINVVALNASSSLLSLSVLPVALTRGITSDVSNAPAPA
ncbi:hypothetical protein B9Y74_05430 [Stenotrophomonas maltophilia]|nr:hypothetical protein [Stenotrophomonas maltophilia]PJL51440.1 hypothetical protein B9Y74_05430 [Stenotrophomonas maltophilia]